MRVLGFDAPGRAGFGSWVVVDDRRGGVFVAAGDTLRTTTRVSEADQLRALDAVFDRARLLGVGLVVLERPFIFEIAGWVGAAKLAAATRDIRWVVFPQATARKLALGHGEMGKGKAGRVRRQAESMAAAVGWFGARRINSQHRADAAMYARAGIQWAKRSGGCDGV